MSNQLPPILTVEQFAELCKCSQRTLEEKARNGILPGLKMGDSWIFPTEATLRAINRLAEEEATTRAKPTEARAIKKLVPVKAASRPNLAALG